MWRRVLTGIFRSYDSTGDKATDPNLKTRYYKRQREKIWDDVVSALKKVPGCIVLHEVPNVGEIICEKKTKLGRIQDITVTLVAVSPVETAIDIYSASRGSWGDLGSNYRTIQQLFRAIDRALADCKVTNR